MGSKNTWNIWVSKHVNIKFDNRGSLNINVCNRKIHKKDDHVNTAVDLKHKKVVERPNRVLFLNIIRPEIKITTHVLYAIFCRYGQVLRVVMFHKFRDLKAFIEFANENDSVQAKNQASGFHYGCCTLKTEFAKISHLTVSNNNMTTWNYEISPLLDYTSGSIKISKPLISTPSSSGSTEKQETIVKMEWILLKKRSSEDIKTEHSDLPWDILENSLTIASNSTLPLKCSKNEVKITSGLVKGSANVHLNPANNQKLFLLYVYGLDPKKSNCDHVFRILSLFTYVAKVRYFQPKLDCALAEVENIQDINILALLQNIKLAHGKNLSFQYCKNYWITGKNEVQYFKLLDGSPSFVDYTNIINQTTFSSSFPSKVIAFYNTPPDLNVEILVRLLRKYLGKNKKFEVKLWTLKTVETKKEKDADSITQLTAKGSITFDSVADALEAIMHINYIIFYRKADKKMYTLKLSFTSEEL